MITSDGWNRGKSKAIVPEQFKIVQGFFVVLQENKENANMKMTLKDESVKEYAQPMAVIDIARDLSNGPACMACAGEVNGEVVWIQDL